MTTSMPASPTQPYWPTPSYVGALLASRGNRAGHGTGQFDATSRPSISQVQSLIEDSAADVDAEFIDSTVPEPLARLVRSAIALRTAATIELTFFPEQEAGSADTSGLLWSRYQTALTRIRQILEDIGGGATGGFGSAVGRSATVAAFTEQFGFAPDGYYGEWLAVLDPLYGEQFTAAEPADA